MSAQLGISLQVECERLRDSFVRTYHKTDKKAMEALLRDWDRLVTS